MNIKFLKLNNGEELVGILTLAEGKATLKNPVRFIFHEDGASMLPAYPLIKDKAITFDASQILFIADVDEDVRNGFNAKLGNGLVLPPSASETPTLVLA